MPAPLAAAGLGAAAALVLLAAGLVVDHWPFAADRAILLALRRPDAPAVPIGPRWLLLFLQQATALGSVPVLTLAVIAAAGLFVVQRRWVAALLAVAATLSGSGVVTLVKRDVARARPELVPHLTDATGMSFPSGHSAGSAMVYLTLAALGAQVIRTRAVRRYVGGAAIALVLLIGVSRVYLGVHWPSDVLAGWCFGTLWALAWRRLGAHAHAAAQAD